MVSIDMRWKFKSLSDQWKNKSVLTLNVIFAHIRCLATEHDHVHLFLLTSSGFFLRSFALFFILSLLLDCHRTFNQEIERHEKNGLPSNQKLNAAIFLI